MAEKEDIQSDDDAQQARSNYKAKKNRKILILLLIIVLPVAYILLFTNKNVMSYYINKIQNPFASQNSDDQEAQEFSKTVYYDIEEFIVNLNTANNSNNPSFLKITLSLEVANEEQIKYIEDKMPRIRDGFQLYLRQLNKEDLKGSAGMYRLREELLLRINKIVYPAKVNDILFKQILVQ